MIRNVRTPKVSVVIPTLNEEKNLPHVLPLIPFWVYEIIIVDGLSIDNTIKTARRLIKGIKIVRVKNKGKGIALIKGFKTAQGDIIVMLDADGSTNPLEINVFIDSLKRGSDLVKGSRFKSGGGSSDITIIRKLGNLFLVKLTNLLFGANFTDLCYGYVAFWSDILPLLDLDDAGFEIETAICIKAVINGLRVEEIPSLELCRNYGKSKLHPIRDGLRILKVLFRDWYKFRLSML